jgi:hypothetical protein
MIVPSIVTVGSVSIAIERDIEDKLLQIDNGPKGGVVL